MYAPRTHNREPSQGARDHQLAGVAGPAAAEYPPRYLLVGLGWLQRAQAASADLDHLVTRLGSISAHLCSRSFVMVIVFWVVSYCHYMLRFWE
jgi:hypothetical protein